MGIVTYTRAAKCKDCKFCIPHKRGKLKRHYCDKLTSPRNGNDVKLSDIVCSEWKL